MINLLDDYALFPEGEIFVVEQGSDSGPQNQKVYISIDDLRTDTSGNALSRNNVYLIHETTGSEPSNRYHASFRFNDPSPSWFITKAPIAPMADPGNALFQHESGEDDELEAAEFYTFVLRKMSRLLLALETQATAQERIEDTLQRAVDIHKAAVQNAVDIVQTKRIEMNETDDDSEAFGPLAVTIFLTLLELHVFSMVGAAVVGAITKTIVRAQVKSVTRAVKLKRILKLRERRETFVKQLHKKYDTLEKMQKMRKFAARKDLALNLRRKKIKKSNLAKFDKKFDRVEAQKPDSIFPIDDRKDKEQISKFILQYEKRASREFAKTETLMNTKVQELVRTSVMKADAGQNLSLGQRNAPIKPGEVEFKPTLTNFVPSDVLFKAKIQNLWDNHLAELKSDNDIVKTHVKELRAWLDLGADLSELEELNDLQQSMEEAIQSLDEMKAPEELNAWANELEDAFEDINGWKWQLTAEYEFMIWALVYSPNIKVTYYKTVGYSTIDLDRKIRQQILEEEYREIAGDIESGAEMTVVPNERIRRILPYLRKRFFDDKLSDEKVLKRILETAFDLPDHRTVPNPTKDTASFGREWFFDATSLLNQKPTAPSGAPGET